MPFIIYSQQPDNKLAVIIPTGNVSDCIKDVPVDTPYTIVDSLEGVDDVYFDGFIYADGKAVADIVTCKKIHLDKFRAARTPLLEKLDIEYIRALEAGNTTKATEIASKKQELRDVTKIELPNTLEELKEVWPEILN